MISSMSLYVVPGEKSVATQCTIVSYSIIQYHTSFQVVSGDEFLVTHTTGIRIVPSMTLNVSFYVVLTDETLATKSTLIWILPRLTFQVFSGGCSF